MNHSTFDNEEDASERTWEGTPFSEVRWEEINEELQTQLRQTLRSELGSSELGQQIAEVAEISRYEIYDPVNGIDRPPQIEGPISDQAMNELNDQLHGRLQDYGVPEYEAQNTFVGPIQVPTTHKSTAAIRLCRATCPSGVVTAVSCDLC